MTFRNLSGRVGLLTALLLLTGCTAPLPLPAAAPELAVSLPAQLHLTEAHGEREWLAVLATEADTLRFTLLSPLGAPSSRLVLSNGVLTRDGFQAPSRDHERLLAGLLFALTRADRLAHHFPTASQPGADRELCFSARSPCWHSATQPSGGWLLQLGDEEWRIELLSPALERRGVQGAAQ